jgi:hypothetical protein
MKTKMLIAMIALTGCSTGSVKKPNHFQVQAYIENKRRYPNLYPLTVKEQFLQDESKQ